jgi:hypothetical protein
LIEGTVIKGPASRRVSNFRKFTLVDSALSLHELKNCPALQVKVFKNAKIMFLGMLKSPIGFDLVKQKLGVKSNTG